MIVLQDAGSNLYYLSVNDQGYLFLIPGFGTPTTLFMNDSSGASWQITIVSETAGEIAKGTSVSTSSYPTSVAMQSPNFTWNIKITTQGYLFAVPGNPLLADIPIVF